MRTCCGRAGEVQRHFARRTNEAMAYQALSDGVEYRARVHNPAKGRRVKALVTASAPCREALQYLAQAPCAILPFAASRRRSGTGFPRGARRWTGIVRLESGVEEQELAACTSEYERALAEEAPTVNELLSAYGAWFGHGAEKRKPCGDRRCPRCWQGASRRILYDRSPRYQNYLVSQEEDHEETGVKFLKGASVQHADRVALEELYIGEHSGWDIQFANDAERSGMRPMGRLAFCFEHTSNPQRNEADEKERADTVWMAVVEYVTAGKGQDRKSDLATGHPVFNMRRRLSFFPATQFLRTVHMVHACSYTGASPCRLERDAGGHSCFRHNYSNRTFIMNEHFHHGIGRREDD